MVVQIIFFLVDFVKFICSFNEKNCANCNYHTYPLVKVLVKLKFKLSYLLNIKIVISIKY